MKLKKGWLRCKHGVLLKRGKKVVGDCPDCKWLEIHVEQALTEIQEQPKLVQNALGVWHKAGTGPVTGSLRSPDKGVT